MAKLKTEGTHKLFLKEMKKKFTENEGSKSSVFVDEARGKPTPAIVLGGTTRVKGKRTTPAPDIKLDRCALCNGRLGEGTTEFMARAGGEVVIINNVPALVCEQCGEAYYSVETSRKIDAVMNEAHRKKLCVRPVPAGEVSLNF
jgi:YgiT-type zinc finger domain-containing protein